jgi:diaminopimelate decarboxylase
MMNPSQLLETANTHGSPLYVYDGHIIQAQYERLTAAFKGVKQLRINYAVKALSTLSVLSFIKDLGAGMDTVSIQEIELALLAGVESKNIIFTPNGVSLQEIEKAAVLGVQINIDNLSILEQFGTRHPEIPVCVRVNPHVMAGGNTNISVGHIDSKFGISIHQ